MHGDEDTSPDPDTDSDAVTTPTDPEGLKDALGRTGRMLSTAGLPFDEDEFDEADDDSTSSSSESEDGSGDSAEE
jgi:hypothetical protein